MKNRKLLLQERIYIACEEGLWRTYSDNYTHSDLDRFKVPKTTDELNEKQLEILATYRDRFPF